MGLSPRAALLTYSFVQLAVLNIGIFGRRLNTTDTPQNRGLTKQLAERPTHDKIIVFKVSTRKHQFLPLNVSLLGHLLLLQAVSYAEDRTGNQHA